MTVWRRLRGLEVLEAAPHQTATVQVGEATTWAIGVTGGFHSCATSSDDSLWCWGYNWYGQLGDGTTTPETTPMQVIFAN